MKQQRRPAACKRGQRPRLRTAGPDDYGNISMFKIFSFSRFPTERRAQAAVAEDSGREIGARKKRVLFQPFSTISSGRARGMPA